MPNANARVMVPIKIVPSMVKAGTSIAEPDTTLAIPEVAWVSGSNYAVGIERTYAGSEYIVTAAITGRTVTPDIDYAFWKRVGPSNRMAVFDDFSSTKSVSTGSITHVLQVGFLNGVAIYGMEGASYSIIVKDAPGGTIIRSKSGDLYEQAAGFYELLFSSLPAVSQISIDDVPLAPNAEVTITVTSSPGARVAIGTIKLGDWRRFIGDGRIGSTQYGANATLKSYTYRKPNPDGTYDTILRPSSRDVNCTVIIDAEQAMYADSILVEIINTAVPFEASDLPNYAYLNTLGFLSGSMTADNHGETSLSIKLTGNV